MRRERWSFRLSRQTSDGISLESNPEKKGTRLSRDTSIRRQEPELFLVGSLNLSREMPSSSPKRTINRRYSKWCKRRFFLLIRYRSTWFLENPKKEISTSSPAPEFLTK